MHSVACAMHGNSSTLMRIIRFVELTSFTIFLTNSVRIIGIIWRRDDGNPIITKVNNKTRRSDTVEGELISFNYVDRRQMGAYLCIAKNDVPPAVSKMIHLNVNCKAISYYNLILCNDTFQINHSSSFILVILI